MRWVEGQLQLDQHPDLDAELALIAFGGAEVPCMSRYRLWTDALADGGFLGEWYDGEFDRARRWWLAMALERMRNEGFHEFLREIPLARARRMGQFLTEFPDAWIDRAACTVAASRSVLSEPNDRVDALLRAATARRLRHGFALSIGGRHVPLGAAALVPLSVTVDPFSVGSRQRVAVEGRLEGRTSQARLVVDSRWLADVWGAGAQVIEGDLVLALEYGVEHHPVPDHPVPERRSTSRAATAWVVRWEAKSDEPGRAMTARLTSVEVEHDRVVGWRVSEERRPEAQ